MHWHSNESNIVRSPPDRPYQCDAGSSKIGSWALGMKPPLRTVMDSSAGMGNSEDYRWQLSPRGFCLLINRLKEPSMAPLSPEDRPLYERFRLHRLYPRPVPRRASSAACAHAEP